MEMRKLVLLQLVATAVFGSHDVFGQFVWTKDPLSPVLSGGSSGAWNQNVFNPCVLYNADSGRYEMWFGACTAIGAGPYSIGFATSIDRVTWSMHPTPVLSPDPGTWDEGWVGDQRVVRENGQYKMWYVGYPSNITKIGYATSVDGITWLKDKVHNPVMGAGDSAWEAGGVDYPFIMPVSGGYRMWYMGWSAEGAGQIGCATSVDGITWQKDTLHNPVLRTGVSGQWDDGLIGQPVVVRLDSAYYMWYSAAKTNSDTSRAGIARSSDGTNGWAKDATNPIYGPSLGSWDAGATTIYSVILRSTKDTFDLWSDGIASGRSYSIGHAKSPYGLWVRLVAPADSADLKSNSFRLTWNHTAIPAVGYHLQLASDSLFAQLLIDESTLTDTSYLITGIANGNYWWRLSARDANGWGIFSNIRRLRVITGISADRNVPTEWALAQNYPNPFNPTTVVNYQLPAVSDVRLVVYDLLGREVAVLVDEKKAPGRYEVRFDAAGLASGIYLYRLAGADFVQTRKMVIVK